LRNTGDRRLGVWWIAEDHPHLPAIVDSPSGRAFTFGELTAAAHRLAHGLRARGIARGDIVAYALPNDVDAVIWQLATSEIGLRYLSLNPSLSAEEFRSILDHSAAAVVVAHPDYADRLADLGTRTSPRLHITVGVDIPGFESQDALTEGQPGTAPADRRLGGPIRYSSGTTGRPKGIIRPVPDIDPSAAASAMSSFGRAFGFPPLEGVHLVSAGMHHGGCQGFYLGALDVGQALAIMGRFDAERALAMIERHAVTTAYLVPTQFVRMLRLPEEVRTRYDPGSLRAVVHSAAPCPPAVKKAMLDWWGPVIWETYGGMEGAATIATPQQWLERPGTVGRAIRGMAVTILDDEGARLPAGEVGHVYLEPRRGPTFEYRGDPGLTESVHRGRAFTIGDLGYLDADGFLFICDRAKDMIISGGVNIYPAEVEGVLAAHPAVGDVAVIGVPDAEWGEQVKAVVELVDGLAPSRELAEELIRFGRDRLAGYKCPRTVDFDRPLPRTEAGKLVKRDIRAKYWTEAGRKV